MWGGLCHPIIFLGGNMASRKQREKLRLQKIERDKRIDALRRQEEKPKIVDLSEAKPEPKKSSTTKKKTTTTKKRASQKAKE